MVYDPKKDFSMIDVYEAYSHSVTLGLNNDRQGSPPIRPKTFAKMLKNYYDSQSGGSVVFYYRKRSLIGGLAMSKVCLNSSD